MDHYERIADAFHSRINCIAGAVDELAPGLQSAARLLLQAVLDDRKIFICACAVDAPLGDYLAALLRSPADARPALPALALTSAELPEPEALLWRDLRTLSRDGDVLLCLDSEKSALFALRCEAFAQQRNLVCVALSQMGGQVPGARVSLHAEEQALRRELLLMACHCLQDEIRHHMLGA